MHVAVLARHGERDLPFEIEMLLAADLDAPAQPVRRPASAAAASPRCITCVGSTKLSRRERLVDRHDRRQDSYSITARSAAARASEMLSAATANIDCPAYSTSPSAKIGSPGNAGPTSLTPGTSVRRQHRDDTGRGRDRGQVHADDPRMRVRRQCDVGVQQAARLRHVVDVDSLAADMLARAVMRDAWPTTLSGAAQRREPGASSQGVRMFMRLLPFRQPHLRPRDVVSSQKRSSRFFATSRR